MSRSDKKVLKDFQRYGSTIATYSIPGLWEGLTLADAFKNPAPRANVRADRIPPEMRNRSTRNSTASPQVKP